MKAKIIATQNMKVKPMMSVRHAAALYEVPESTIRY
jgi:hypothetical protein